MRRRGRLLFVGWPDVVHNQRWMALCRDLGFAVRLFALRGSRLALRGLDVATPGLAAGRPGSPRPRLPVAARRERAHTIAALTAALRSYGPDVVHCFGVDPAAYLTIDALPRPGRGVRPPLVVQMRGGPEQVLNHHAPDHAAATAHILSRCDGFLADSEPALEVAVAQGLSVAARSRWIGPVPGGGGVETDALRARWSSRPIRPRRIIWPKAFHNPSVSGASVLEGLRLAWPAIGPAEMRFFFVHQEELVLWMHHALPAAMLDAITLAPVVPHDALLGELLDASVLLAPSLLDGVSNVLLEAMAAGALPIVSPHPTLPTSFLRDGFLHPARNLYPDEIAASLIAVLGLSAEERDARAQRNFELVRRAADRGVVGERVRAFYAELVGRTAQA